MRPRVLFVFRGIKFKDQPETRRGGVEVVAAGELNYIVDTNQINLAYERLLNICVIDVCLIINVGWLVVTLPRHSLGSRKGLRGGDQRAKRFIRWPGTPIIIYISVQHVEDSLY